MDLPRPELALVPRPRRLSTRSGRFRLDETTRLRVTPGAGPAAALLRSLLAPATGLPLPASADGAFVLALDPALTGLGEEGYGLTVSPQGVLLRAAHPAGLLHGVQTVRQLLPYDALSGEPVRGVPWDLPAVEITDVPRHPWRGSMLDVARHFQPVSYLRRYVDLMALHKLNVFHLHLTDDQGWRMPVAAYPRLTEVGGVRTESMAGPAGTDRFDGVPHGGAYTRAELRDLVAYAAERGVRVLPETGVPGHVRAALAAHPELGTDPGRRLDVWTHWGVCENVLGTDDHVLDFFRTVLDEVMDVFPSPYVHLGGDECPTVEWERSAAARARAAAEGLPGPRALHPWFISRMSEHVVRAGRRPVVWAENGVTLPLECTVMSWREPAHAHAAARRGHEVVHADHRATYFDYPRGPGAGEPPGQPGGFVDLRAVYDVDLAPPEPGAASRVLGAQGQLWTEFVPTPEHVEYLTYPRLCALAERVWDGAYGWRDFTARLAGHRARLDALGVPHAAAPARVPAPHPTDLTPPTLPHRREPCGKDSG
ncbi:MULTISPECIES: beta-N-acetylhexosaminidase [Streptomyces]|uniref:beta-N-acetylhexosaminidase n=1 Tax=Streptomyces parvulus TaxID=146923 RepID=A0A191V7L6_9ACTN|nr:beta-N-acetylhexosaminidase [Streptomyces parvulus]ANJ11016.1 beta-hexosaminidase [Streptomyces parvulus]MZD52289.1 family 20 glycosylhydrolase [Streptomyces sp. SID5606]GGR66979.1 beta-hexosaminidase [Streptomyces parvulus]